MQSLKGKEKAINIDLPPSYENSVLLTKSCIFDSLDLHLTVLGTVEQPWFVAQEFCQLLGITNSRNVVARLPVNMTGVQWMDTEAGRREKSIINEDGLLEILMTVRNNDNTSFARQKIREILKEIRLKGKYELESRVNELANNEKRLLEDKEAAEARERKAADEKAEYERKAAAEDIYFKKLPYAFM